MTKRKGKLRFKNLLKDFLLNKIDDKKALEQEKILRKRYEMYTENGSIEKPYILENLCIIPFETQISKKFKNCIFEKREYIQEMDLFKIFYKGVWNTDYLYFKVPSVMYKLKIHEYNFHYYKGKIIIKKYNEKIDSFETNNINGYCDFQNTCYSYQENIIL